MNRIALGAFLALLFCGLGLFWWQGRAAVERAAPPPVPQPVTDLSDPDHLPQADASDLEGPAPPVASELNKEQQRFFRYDRNRDWRISRNEMLSTRTAGFKALDRNGNNLLEFEEWAVTTVEKFEGADTNADRELSPREFETTKPKPMKRRSCAC